MKVLSVKQPWATLVVAGATQYLVRSWRTFHRGPLAVHASGHLPRSHVELCCDDAMRRVLRRCGYDYAMELPRRVVLGVVTVADCLFVTEDNRELFDPGDPAVIFGLIQPDRWVWVCTNARRLPQPVPLVGHLGVFDLPESRTNAS